MTKRRLPAIAIGTAIAVQASLLAGMPRAGAQSSGPDQLVFTTQPGGASGGTPFTTQPVVTVQAPDGSTVTSSNVTVELSLTGGPGGATLACAPATAVAGVATFAGCSIDKAGTGYQLHSTATGVVAADSQSFDVAVGPPAQVGFTTQPSTIRAGAPFPAPPAVELRDAGGNPVPPGPIPYDFGLVAIDDTDLPVTLEGCTGGSPHVEQGATFHRVPGPGNSAAFPGCTVGPAGTGYTLLAVAVPDDATGEVQVGSSTAFDVLAGAPVRLAFVTQPSGGVPGEPLPRQPAVAVQDAAGNTVASASTPVSLAAPGLVCTNNPVTATAGVATFDGCRLGAPGTYTLTATAPGGLPPAASSPVLVSAGAPALLRFTTQPGDGTGGLPLARQPVVEVLDGGGARVSGPVTLSLEGSPAGVSLSCSRNTAPAGTGEAAFFGCAVDRPGTWRLQATGPGGLVATSDPFTVVVGGPARMAFVSTPSATSAGAGFPVVVELRDAGGNLAAGATDGVRLSLRSGGPPGARLSCGGGTSVAAVAGVARFDPCSVDRPGTHSLVAASTAGVAESGPFTVGLGGPASLTFLSAPLASTAGGLLATPQVLVRDAGGNALDTGVSLSVAGGSLEGCATSGASFHGVAAFPGCTLKTSAKAVTLRATAGGASATAEVPVSKDPPVGSAAAPLPLRQSFGGGDYANNPSPVANDVNPATGALTFSSEDLRVAGLGVPFELVRTYNSADGEGGRFGPGWSSIFDAGVSFENPDTAVVRGEDGQRVVFKRDPKCRKGNADRCAWIGPAGARSSLTCKKERCTVTRFDGMSLVSEGGRIASFLSRSGRGLRFTYDPQGNPNGVEVETTADPLRLAVTVDGGGLITRVETPTRSTGYAYTGGRLASFTDAAGHTTAYAYDPAGRLAGWSLGQEALAVGYAPDGRVQSARRTGQPRRYDDTYEWSAGGSSGIGTSTRHTRLTAHDLPAVGSWVHRVKGNVVLTEQRPDGATLAFSFDSGLNLVAVQGAVGEVQRMTYDNRGDLVRQIAPDGGTRSFAYDGEHRIVSVTDEAGNTTSFRYANDKLKWVVPPDPADPQNQPGPPGEVGTHYGYDGHDLLVSVKTPTSVRNSTHDRFGNETSFQLYDRPPDGAELGEPLNGMGPRSTYDEAGNVISVVDPRGHLADGSTDPAFETTFTYDATGRRTSMTEPGGRTTLTGFTPAGQVASLTRPGAAATSYAWDEPVLTRTATGGSGGRWVYDESGNVLSHVDGGGRSTDSVYDASGRLVAETDPGNVTIRFSRNAAGLVVAMADSLGRTGDMSYDVAGRVVRRAVDGRVSATMAYDAAGRLVAETDEAGRATTYTYDNHGRMASVTDPTGTTTYGYDGDGNVVAVTDGNGHTTTYAYDGAGRRVSKTVAGNTWTYAYDVAGNLVSTTDPDGRTAAFTLDAGGRRTRIVHSQPGRPGITVEQSFDAAGRRTALVDPTGTTSFDYDAVGNLTRAAGPAGTFTYDFSTPGAKVGTYPDGTAVTYRYDDAQRLMRLSAPGVDVAYTRDSARRITGVASGNGLFETRGYDGADRLASQDVRCGAGSVLLTRYGYDAEERPLGWDRSVGGQTTTAGYGYDAAGRLAAQDLGAAGSLTLPGPACSGPGPAPTPAPPAPGSPLPPAPTEVNDPVPVPGLTGLAPSTANPIGYDAVGNRTSAGGATFGYDAADRLVSASDGRSAAYDGAGNLTSSTVGGQTTTYAYDAAGRLSQVTTPGGRVIGYTYDGDGNRVGKSVDGAHTTTLHWDRGGTLPLLALEQDAGGGFRRYFHGIGPVALQTDVATFYMHTDRRGDVVALSDGRGGVVATYTYDGFGNATLAGDPAGAANPLRFGGQHLDPDTGLYNMRARQYDPSTGRFTQRDPVTPRFGRPVVSPYVYADDQPTVLSDPEGRVPNPFEAAGHATESSNWVSLVQRSSAIGAGAGKGISTVAIKAAQYYKYLPEGELDELTDASKTFGKAAAVLGIALSAYVAVDDCMHGPPELCVSSVVALAFNIGCLAVTNAAGAVFCSALGVGLSVVIAEFGPEIAEAFVQAAEGFAVAAKFVGKEIDAAFTDLGRDFEDFGADVAIGFTAVGGSIATGFNRAGSAIASGFDDAIDTLVRGGLGVVEVARLLKGQFGLAGGAIVGTLIEAGYALEDVAVAVVDTLAGAVDDAAEFLKAVGYGVGQVAVGLRKAFDNVAGWSERALADALAAAGYAVGEIADGLKAAYNLTVEQYAVVVAGLNYAVSEIAGVMQSAYNATAAEVTAIFKDLEATAGDVAAALKDLYNASAAEVASLLKAADYSVQQIASGLQEAYGNVAGWSEQALADALRAAGYAASEILSGLQSAVDATAEAAAQVLHALGYATDEIAAGLKSAYSATADAVTGIFNDIGVGATAIASTLSSVYGQTAGAINRVLGSAGIDTKSIGGFFSDTSKKVAKKLNPKNWF